MIAFRHARPTALRALKRRPPLPGGAATFHTSRAYLAKASKAPPATSKHGKTPKPLPHLKKTNPRPLRPTPRPPSSSRPEKESLSSLFAQRKLPLVAAGLAAACIGLYVSLVVSSVLGSSSSVESTHDHHHGTGAESEAPTGRPPELREGRISAAQFDLELDWPEWLMGVTKLRRQFAQLARGHVLEVAVGTGRNIPYYDWEEIKAEAPRPAAVVDAADGAAAAPAPSEKPRRSQKVRSDGLPPDMLSFTGVDISGDVLDVAWTKLKKAVPELVPKRKRRRDIQAQAQPRAVSEGRPAASTTGQSPQDGIPKDEVLTVNLGGGRIRLFQGDAEDALPPPPAVSSPSSPSGPRKYYDTILQTFGLCSVADPSRLLAEMASMLQPGTGRIVLLEHGRGWYGFVNGLLDKFAPGHFAKFGCWWNRDIEGIVRAAAEQVPGLEVVRVARPGWFQFGTTLWIVLRVKGPGEDGQQGEGRKVSFWSWLTDRDTSGRV